MAVPPIRGDRGGCDGGARYGADLVDTLFLLRSLSKLESRMAGGSLRVLVAFLRQADRAPQRVRRRLRGLVPRPALRKRATPRRRCPCLLRSPAMTTRLSSQERNAGLDSSSDLLQSRPASGAYRPFGTLRTALAGLVMLHHFGIHLAGPDLAAALRQVDLGRLAVVVFFVLSGFVITEAAVTFYSGRPIAFASNRLLRICTPTLCGHSLVPFGTDNALPGRPAAAS